MGELGQYLKEGRDRAGLSREALSSTLRLSAKVVAALEEERWVDLPQKVYIKGWVASYCKAVGIDPKQALEALPSLTDQIATTIAPDGLDNSPMGEIMVGTRRLPGVNWAYLLILLVFVVGIVVALLTVGTGADQEDVSRLVPLPALEETGGKVQIN